MKKLRFLIPIIALFVAVGVVKAFSGYADIVVEGNYYASKDSANLGSGGGVISAALLTAVKTDIIPDTNNAYDLGSSTYTWQDLYLSGYLTISTTTQLAKLAVTGPNSLTVDAVYVASSTDGSPLLRVKGKNGDVSFGNDGFLYEASSTIAYIGGINSGNLSFPTNAGLVMGLNLPLDSDDTAYDEMRYDFGVGDLSILSIGCRADGSGFCGTTSTIGWGTFAGLGYNDSRSFGGNWNTATSTVLATSSGVPFNLMSWQLPATSTQIYKCQVLAHEQDGTDWASYDLSISARSKSSVVQATTTVLMSDESNTGFDASSTIVGNALNMSVSGLGSNTIWKGFCGSYPIGY